jgi:transcriptional regulator with XRE-family HTH domain
MQTERFVTRKSARTTPRTSLFRFEIVACRARRNYEVKTAPPRAKADAETVFKKKSSWVIQERREAYMEASVEQGIAWQIKINREKRGLSQSQLATLLDTKQPAISRLEDPDYGAHSLDTLLSIAKAFDCALQLRFISYSQLAIRSEKLAPDDLYAAPFSVEKELFHG